MSHRHFACRSSGTVLEGSHRNRKPANAKGEIRGLFQSRSDSSARELILSATKQDLEWALQGRRDGWFSSINVFVSLLTGGVQSFSLFQKAKATQASQGGIALSIRFFLFTEEGIRHVPGRHSCNAQEAKRTQQKAFGRDGMQHPTYRFQANFE